MADQEPQRTTASHITNPRKAIRAVKTLVKTPMSRLFYKATPGRRPGINPDDIAASPTPDQAVGVTCIDYGTDKVSVEQVANLEAFLAQPHPQWGRVRWLDINSVSDLNIIKMVTERYGLHPLIVEDILHVPQRPKAEIYPVEDSQQDCPGMFIIAQMNRLIDGRIISEQVSICTSHNTVLTFQEKPGDVWDPIRQRINKASSRLRSRKTGYLTYALLDALIDHNFSILERYGEELESLEELTLDNPSAAAISRIHAMKRELLLLRRQVWPTREVVSTLLREEHPYFSEETRLFMRDAYDHAVQVLDVVETYREVASGLIDTHMTVVGNRMNDVMKTLTMVATIFIPISFLAGVFGMNMDDLPGMHTPGAFLGFAVACLTVAGSMLAWFKHKGWL